MDKFVSSLVTLFIVLVMMACGGASSPNPTGPSVTVTLRQLTMVPSNGAVTPYGRRTIIQIRYENAPLGSRVESCLSVDGKTDFNFPFSCDNVQTNGSLGIIETRPYVSIYMGDSFRTEFVIHRLIFDGQTLANNVTPWALNWQ